MLQGISKITKYAILLALVAFSVRAVVTTVYVRAYDRYQDAESETDGPTGPVHAMIKGDAAKYHAMAAMIVEQVREGENPFLAGSRHSGPLLYQRVIAAYTLLSGQTTVDSRGRVVIGQVWGFLILQSFLFSLCLVPFFLSISRIAGLPIALGATGFLALEPTLVQYSAFMFTEELFIGLMLLSVAVWINVCNMVPAFNRREALALMLLGVLLGLAFLQRPQAILLPAVFVAGLLSRSGWMPGLDFWKRSGVLLVPYMLVLAVVALHNLGRAGAPFIAPTQAPMGWQNYLANKVVAEVEGTDPEDETIRLGALALARAKSQGLVAEHVTRNEDATEIEVFEIYGIYQKQAFEIFAQHPVRTLRIAAIETAGALVVNLPAPYRFYSTVHKPESDEQEIAQFAQRQAHKPFTITYSLLLLVPAALGWLLFRRAFPAPVNAVLVLIIVYFTGTGGWIGNPRYTLPNLTSYAIYWSAFVVLSGRRWLDPPAPTSDSKSETQVLR
jgi:hypothetical protein